MGIYGDRCVREDEEDRLKGVRKSRWNYTFTDLILVFFLGVIVGTLIIASVIQDAKGDAGRRDAQGIAQCIEEYDYTHPGRTMHANLVRAIQWCNIGDRAVAHECITPCIVKLPKGTLEDEFDFDYGWTDKNHSQIRVWVKGR